MILPFWQAVSEMKRVGNEEIDSMIRKRKKFDKAGAKFVSWKLKNQTEELHTCLFLQRIISLRKRWNGEKTLWRHAIRLNIWLKILIIYPDNLL